MILKMEKVSVFGLLRDKDAVVKGLMRARCVQVKAPESMDGYEELLELTRRSTVDVYEKEVQLSRYSSALSGMAQYAAKPGLFAQKPRVQYDSLQDGDMMDKAQGLCGEIEDITGQIAELKSAKSKDMFLKTSLEPWQDCGLPLQETGTIQTSIGFYMLPAKTDGEALEEKRREAAPASLVQVISQDREQQYIAAVCHRSQEDELWEVLKEFGAAKASFPAVTGTASENIALLEERITGLDKQIQDQEEALRALGEDISPVKYAYDALSVEIQREKAAEDFLATEQTFCFTGWVPEVAKDQAVKILEEHGCCYQFSQPADDEEPPVLLRNNKWATPYESVVEMYSLPAYRGFDPDMFVSIFYFIFFGMMLSDAGFGLILFFGGLWLKKKLDLGAAGKKLVTVITMGGLSAVIWGAIFGSWFGDLVEVVAREFFHVSVTVPQLIDPLQDAVLVMGLSMAMGFVHILVGMCINAYMLIKRGKPLDALFDVGFWILVLVGLVLMLASLAGIPALMTVGTVMAVVGAVGLILTQGRNQKNPIMKIGSGIISLYDVTGYFSDVLSYSRILALGLATGVIAQVVNIMGTLAGGGILGAIVFILVFAAGSTLNLGINTLGAYVHTARLQYVEFFGKFYEAGGRPFSPLSPQTKYLVVTNKEEQ